MEFLEQFVIQMIKNVEIINNRFELCETRIKKLENKVSKLEEQLKNK